MSTALYCLDKLYSARVGKLIFDSLCIHVSHKLNLQAPRGEAENSRTNCKLSQKRLKSPNSQAEEASNANDSSFLAVSGKDTPLDM